MPVTTRHIAARTGRLLPKELGDFLPSPKAGDEGIVENEEVKATQFPALPLLPHKATHLHRSPPHQLIRGSTPHSPSTSSKGLQPQEARLGLFPIDESSPAHSH